MKRKGTIIRLLVTVVLLVLMIPGMKWYFAKQAEHRQAMAAETEAIYESWRVQDYKPVETYPPAYNKDDIAPDKVPERKEEFQHDTFLVQTVDDEIARAEKAKKKEIKKLKNFYDNLSVYTDMSENLGISRETFVEIFSDLSYDEHCVFRNYAGFIWDTAKKYDFNEFLMVGIMAQESRWCTNPITPHNYSSQRIGGDDFYTYDSTEEGIEVLAESLAKNYLSSKGKYYNGTSLIGMNIRYCETDEWDDGVCGCIQLVLKEYLDI